MPKRLTRRDIGRIALASAAAMEQAAAQPPAYSGPLTGFENKVDMAGFDPVIFSHKLHDAAPLRMAFRATTRPAALKWQQSLRAKVAELLGGFPATPAPLQPQTLETREFPSYTREKFVFQSRPGCWVLGYLLTPKQGRAPHATVIALPGHGRGVDDIVGIDEQGRDRTARTGYAFDYAVQIVENGMAAVAIEPMAFGCRRDAVNKTKRLGDNACQPASGAALLLGQTMVGWRVYDVMRTIDWIATRPQLDSRRIGCMGCSGGGTVTLFSAAINPRIRAVLVSSYLNTFRGSIMSVSHCIDNYVPGILNWAEMPDVAGLIAPRPFFAESGDKDTIFPVATARTAFEQVANIYRIFGAADKAEHEVFDGPHSFWGKRGLPFLARHL